MNATNHPADQAAAATVSALKQDPQPFALPADQVVADLSSNAEGGLSDSVAAQRLAEFGPNELRSVPPVPLWRRVLDQFKDPLVVLLLFAITISTLAWALEGASGVPIDAIVILAVLVLNAVIGLVQEGKANDAVAALQKMTKATAQVVRGGVRLELPSEDLVPGDVILLGEGDQVPADARLLQADSLRVVESSLTGESEPVQKGTATVSVDAQIGDRTDMVFRGTAVAQGSGRAVVTATGTNTEMGAIADLLEAVEDGATPLEQEISGVSKTLGIIVIVIAVALIGILFLMGNIHDFDGFIESLLLAVSLAVAAVPEGLPAILSVVLALGVQRLAKRNAVVKKLSSVETLGSASVICSDKTGTLTRSEMTIQEVVTASGITMVSGVGYEPVGQVAPDQDRDGVPDQEQLEGALADEVTVVLSGGVLASDADLAQNTEGAWAILGDPTEGSFLVAEKKLGTDGAREERFERVGTVPFTSERKLMSVLQKDRSHEDRLTVISKGAPDVLLDLCTQVRVGDRAVPLDEATRAKFTDEIDDMSGRALRTLAVGYRLLSDEEAADIDPDNLESLERDLVLAGVVGIIDPARPEAGDAVAEAQRAGVRVMMITGDHPATAGRIAADLGISEDGQRVLTGAELSAMSDADLDAAVHDVNVYARVAPEHKMRIVRSLQDQGEIVAMTGDGVNDAPALRAADIGVAMGITGTQVTQEAGKMVLADDNFATIVDAVGEGRRIFDNIKKFLRYLLTSNMGEVTAMLLGTLLAGVIGLQADGGTGIVLPLLATQILWINLVTDTAPALAMGVDPSVEDVMGRRPRRTSEKVIDRQMWTDVLTTGILMGILMLLTMDMFLPGGLIEGHDSIEVARTAAFTTLVFAQLFFALCARSETVSAFHHMFSNKWMWGAIALGVVLQIAVVELPFLQAGFGTTHLDFQHWAVAVGMASIVLWADELLKIYRRAKGRRTAGFAAV